MQRTHFLAAASAAVAASSIQARANAGSSSSVAGIGVPTTPLAQEAAALALTAEPREIFNHSLRVFYFAELLGNALKIDHDTEAVYVAALLHDMGLCPKFMSASQRFEVDGANLARMVMERHGVTGRRADLVWDAISLHDQSGIAQWKQPEVMLVSAGVGADFGAHLGSLARGDVLAVLQAAPRDGFVPALLSAVAEFAKRKPQATGNSWVTDVAYRMVPGFHLDNFVDAARDDPFAAYRTGG
jgi:hypothetical protein